MTDAARMSTSTIVLLVIGALVGIPLLAMGGGMMGGGFGMFGGGMFLWPLLFLVGVGVLVYYALTGGSEAKSSDDALETLRQRYARGEITDDEFEERKQTLKETDA
ncbi:SHOCT domain-containing protein [Haloferax sp. DFSO52]|uniref:SHOCT domain-containing protein n=1 Tax=Haloferax sp. DFSO52 TaxID=3388505 RepID=UPI003A8BEE44